MAKNTSDSFDLGGMNDDGFDFEMDGLDFGNPPPPPKNAREAVTRTMKDVGKGMWDDMKDNKLQKVGKLAQASIPASLKTEYSNIADAYGNISNVITDKTNEIKKTANETLKAVSKIMPQNGKIASILNKLSERLEEPKEPKGPSKEEIQAQQIQEGILASLGSLQDKAHADAMVAQAVASKQHATTAQLLQNIYAETKLERTFHYEISNKYYRKSLELQYKHLFTSREQLEVMKLGFETIRSQLEAVTLNTSLPDILKAKGTELLKADIFKKMRDMSTGKLFKAATPFAKNLEKRVQGTIDGFLGGLRGVTEITGAIDQMKEMGSMTGHGLGYQAGSFINDFAVNYLGGKIGKRIGKNKHVQDFAFNVKDLAADPRAGLKEFQKKMQKKGGIVGKALGWLSEQAYGLTSTESVENATYGRLDLNERANFDGRTHSTINKVIPGLLSKIYGEMKSMRVGLGGADGSQFELLFDNKDDRFKTRQELTNSIRSDVKTNLKKGFSASVSQLDRLMKECGVSLSSSEVGVLAQALLGHVSRPGTPINPSMLWSQQFISTIADAKVRAKLQGMSKRLKAELTKDYEKMDSMVSIMQSMKSSLPSYNERFKDLYDSGHGDILTGLGVATLDSYSGNMVSTPGGIQNLLKKSFNANISYDIPEHMIGASSPLSARNMSKKAGDWIDGKMGGVGSQLSGAVGAVGAGGNKIMDWAKTNNESDLGVIKDLKGAIVSGVASTRSALGMSDDETVADYLASSKSKVQDFVNTNLIPGSLKTQQGEFVGVKKSYQQFIKAGEDAIKKAKDPAEREKILTEMKAVKSEVASVMKAVQKEGLSGPTATRLKTKLKERTKSVRKRMPRIPTSVDTKITAIANTSREVMSPVLGGIKSQTGSLARQAMQNEYVAKGVQKAQSAKIKMKQALKWADDQTVLEYLSSQKARVEDFVSEITPASIKADGGRFLDFKKAYQEGLKQFDQMYAKATSQEERDKIKAQLAAYKQDAVSTIRAIQHEGISGPTVTRFKKKAQGRLKQARTKMTVVSNGVINNIANTAISSPLSNMFGDGISNIQAATSSDSVAVSKSIARQIRKRQKRGQKVDKGILRAQFFASEEYKVGNATNFFTWLAAQGYDPDAIEDSSEKEVKKKGRSIWSYAHELDRKMALFLLKTPFKALGAMFKTTGFGLKMGGKASMFALDMLPFGMGKIITGPLNAMAAMANVIVGKKEEEDKKERKGSWLSRLNIFSRKKKGEKELDDPKKSGSLMDKLKKLGTAALLGGAVMLLSKMNISLGDIVNGVSSIASGIGAVFGFIKKIGTGVGNFFGNIFGADKTQKIDPSTGQPMVDENGQPVYEENNSWGTTGGAVATAVGAGAGLYALRHPIKATKAVVTAPFKLGEWLVRKCVGKLRGSWVPGSGVAASTIEKHGPKLATQVDKAAGTVNKMKSKFSWIQKLLKSPKVIAKAGAKVIAKAAAKIVTYIAAAATGIGAILTVAGIIWELGWTLWYMWSKDMSFWEAFVYQLIEVDIRDKELKNDEDIADNGNSDTNAALKSSENTNVKPLDKRPEEASNKPGFLGSLWNGAKNLYNKGKEMLSSGLDTVKGWGSSIWNWGKGVVKSGIETEASRASQVYNYAVGNTESLSGKLKRNGWLEKKPLTENKFPQWSPSPYIVPNPSSYGGMANINGLTDDTKSRLIRFAEEYYDITGRPLYINDAKRDMSKQIKMWEGEAKVKYTGNKEQDMLNMCKAGGKCFGSRKWYEKFGLHIINGKPNPAAVNGTVGYPYAGNPHMSGRGIDIDWKKSPFNNEIKHDTASRHAIDDLLEKHGLQRPYTAFKGYQGSLERWHVTPFGPIPPMDEPDATSMQASMSSGEFNKEVNSEGGIDTSAGSAVARDAASQVATSSAAGSSPAAAAASGAGGAVSSSGAPSTVSAASSASTTSVSGSSTPGMSGGQIESILRQQLDVQSKSMGFLEQILNSLSSNVTPNAAPNPAISIKRREVFG